MELFFIAELHVTVVTISMTFGLLFFPPLHFMFHLLIYSLFSLL